MSNKRLAFFQSMISQWDSEKAVTTTSNSTDGPTSTATASSRSHHSNEEELVIHGQGVLINSRQSSTIITSADASRGSGRGASSSNSDSISSISAHSTNTPREYSYSELASLIDEEIIQEDIEVQEVGGA
jgi:hypothetical protein